MQEHIRETLTDKLLDDKRFRAAFCDGCTAITHDCGDGLFNPPVDECPASFFIGDRDCVRADDWQRIEIALDLAASVAAGSTDKEVYV